MANKYILTRFHTILRSKTTIKPLAINFNVPNRQSSYQNSKKVGAVEDYTSKFEVTRNPDEWAFVERLLAPKVVPKPIPKQEYPSGWKPQNDDLINGKYYVARNRNHMVPVYLTSTHRGMRKVTEITRIKGDVFGLEKDLKQFLETKSGRDVATQVNELVGYIHVKGDYARMAKEFLIGKGF